MPDTNSATHYFFLSLPKQAGDLGTFGRYRVLRKIDSGTFGVLFQAQRDDSTSIIALKILAKADGVEPDDKSRFKREIEALRTVADRNVVTIYDSGEVNGWMFLTMPLLAGENLVAYALNQDLPPKLLLPKEVCQIALGVLSGLIAIHAQGLIHRDIKPSNLWREPDGNMLVLDLGLVASPGNFTDLTKGKLTGTHGYISPEQSNGNPIPKSDVFSLGCVLFQLLSGELPYGTENNFHRVPRKLESLVTGLPPSLADIVELAIRLEQISRPSALELKQRISALMAQDVDAETSTKIQTPAFNQQAFCDLVDRIHPFSHMKSMGSRALVGAALIVNSIMELHALLRENESRFRSVETEVVMHPPDNQGQTRAELQMLTFALVTSLKRQEIQIAPCLFLGATFAELKQLISQFGRDQSRLMAKDVEGFSENELINLQELLNWFVEGLVRIGTKLERIQLELSAELERRM